MATSTSPCFCTRLSPSPFQACRCSGSAHPSSPQHLAAHSRTAWSRDAATPLAGAGGMQFYLWWTPADSPQVSGPYDDDPGLKRSLWVRAVHHHDDMSPLRTWDTEADYFQLHKEDMDGSDNTFVDSPWTDQQLEFVNSSDPVRIVYGYPGSGKTTALWRAVESRTGERVLYTSWSRELVEFASEHLSSFAPCWGRSAGTTYRV